MSDGQGEAADQLARNANTLDIVLLVICQSVGSLAMGALALFLPLIRRDVQLDFAQAGTLATASTLVYAAMQIPAGFLADRFGSKRLFVTGLLGTSIMALTFALADSYLMMLLNQAASGFFRAFLFAPGLVLITARFPPERRATAMGLFVAGGFSSNIFVNLLGPVLVGSMGWRVIFMAFAAAGTAIVLFYSVKGQPGPQVHLENQIRIQELGQLLRHRIMWLCGAVQFVRLAVVQGLAFWLPSLLVEDRGLSLSAAGFIVAIGAVLTAPANFFGGYIADRLGRPTTIVTLSLAALAIGMALLGIVQSVPLVIAVTAFISIFLQLYFGPLFAIPVQIFGPRTAGLVSGFSNLCANLGALSLVLVLGLIKEHTGSFSIGLYALSGLCVAGLLCSLAMRHPARGHSPV